MVVPEPGHFLAPGARITSRVGNTSVFVDVAEIATALDYQRPTRPVNFPRPDETFDQNEIAGYLYEHRRNARIPHWPGRFTTAYRFINQVICFNLYPRGREGAPQRSVGNLMYAFMGEDTVSDWALYIFGQMCDFRDAPTTLRMPFPCLVTKILRTRNVPGKRFYSNDDLLPGDLDSSFIHRSYPFDFCPIVNEFIELYISKQLKWRCGHMMMEGEGKAEAVVVGDGGMEVNLAFDEDEDICGTNVLDELLHLLFANVPITIFIGVTQRSPRSPPAEVQAQAPERFPQLFSARSAVAIFVVPLQQTLQLLFCQRFETSLEPKEHMQHEVELESVLGQNRPWRVRTKMYIQGSRSRSGSSYVIRGNLALSIWAVLLSSHCVGAQVEHYWKVAPRSWEDEASATYILVGNMVAITLLGLLGLLIFYAYRRIRMHANPQEVAGPGPVVVGRVAARRLDQHAIELFPMLSFSGDGTVGFGTVRYAMTSLCTEKEYEFSPPAIISFTMIASPNG
ncbi:hypothetical protein RHGRI_005785 [Rhododendron griersonianum]|uniref:Uncharacterized protein n=1 Tax=Rhododendron griersonianum TaxID=479676 RepID=A0AAV6LFJ5_9ERIC|nr:hypothetical protein RHGRI_005785 [Rhododendron griersonianum]